MTENEHGLSTFEHGTNSQLDDLMTIVNSYDTTNGMSSNAIGAYYHAISGHRETYDFIHETLGAADSESFGGNYGELPPSKLDFSYAHPDTFGIDPDLDSNPPFGNKMSALTMVDWLRRIIMTRGNEEQLFNYEDTKSILYGAESSGLFPGLQFGGMSQSTDI